MAKVPFKYYLHDDSEGYEAAELVSEQTGLNIDFVEDIGVGRYFYEVTFHCTIDDVTGAVEVLSFEL